MTAFQIGALLLALTAGFSYVNHRWIKLPTTIGVMLIALTMSLGLVMLSWILPQPVQFAENILHRVDFYHTLLEGMLSFLLFAGALHINLSNLRAQ